MYGMIELVQRYAEDIAAMGIEPRMDRAATDEEGRLANLAWMCGRIVEMMHEEPMPRIMKANRWLGYVQGQLEVYGLYSIDEMREHNREVFG